MSFPCSFFTQNAPSRLRFYGNLKPKCLRAFLAFCFGFGFVGGPGRSDEDFGGRGGGDSDEGSVGSGGGDILS